MFEVLVLKAGSSSPLSSQKRIKNKSRCNGGRLKSEENVEKFWCFINMLNVYCIRTFQIVYKSDG